jgi:hypothetical protein
MGNISADSKKFGDQQPISRNGAANRLFGVIYQEFEVSIRTIENGESENTGPNCCKNIKQSRSPPFNHSGFKN